jgi:hypothetical protein
MVTVNGPVTDTEIAKALGVTQSTVSGWRRRHGMPNASIDAAKEWQASNRPHKGLPTPPSEVLQAPSFELAQGTDPYDVVSRLQTFERTVSGQIEAWVNVSLPQAREARDNAKGKKALIEAERTLSLIQNKIEYLRKEHRDASKALLNAERMVIKVEHERGRLIAVDAYKDRITKMLAPIIIEIRKLPDSAENEIEKVKLSAIATRLLGILRESAQVVYGSEEA